MRKREVIKSPSGPVPASLYVVAQLRNEYKRKNRKIISLPAAEDLLNSDRCTVRAYEKSASTIQSVPIKM